MWVIELASRARPGEHQPERRRDAGELTSVALPETRMFSRSAQLRPRRQVAERIVESAVGTRERARNDVLRHRMNFSPNSPVPPSSARLAKPRRSRGRQLGVGRISSPNLKAPPVACSKRNVSRRVRSSPRRDLITRQRDELGDRQLAHRFLVLLFSVRREADGNSSLGSRDGVRDARDPRGPGARPRDGRGDHADLPDLDLRAGGGRQAQGLRLLPRREPDPHGARDRAREPRGRRARASPSPRASAPRRR